MSSFSCLPDCKREIDVIIALTAQHKWTNCHCHKTTPKHTMSRHCPDHELLVCTRWIISSGITASLPIASSAPPQGQRKSCYFVPNLTEELTKFVISVALENWIWPMKLGHASLNIVAAGSQGIFNMSQVVNWKLYILRDGLVEGYAISFQGRRGKDSTSATTW